MNTKTQWKMAHRNFDGGVYEIYDAKGELVCAASDNYAPTILLAVNSHDALVEALENAEKDLSAIYQYCKHDGAFVVTIGMFQRLDAARTALKLVKGGV